MAINSTTWNGSYGQYSRLYIELTLASQDIVNNTSTFAYKVRGQSTDVNAGITWFSGSLQLSNAYSKTKAIGNGSFNYSTEFVFDSGTFTISHNAEGTLSAQTLTAYVTLSSGHNATVSASLSVPSIPRASTITTFKNFTIGNNIPWAVDRKYTAYTHIVELVVANTVITSVQSTGASGTLGITLAMKNQMLDLVPSATTIQATLIVRTYTNSNYNVQVGTQQTKTATATVGSDVVPSFTTITHSENVTDVNTKVGAYVQSKTKLNLAITGAVAGQGSTINLYQITVAGQTLNAQSGVSDFINQSGSLSLVGLIRDRRGRTATKTVTINVLAYANPVVSNVSFQRCLSNGTLDLLGEYIKVSARVAVSSLINGTEKNSITSYQVESKKTTDSSWDSKVSTSENAVTYNFENTISGYSVDYAFNTRLKAGDIFGESGRVIGLVPLGQLLMEWYKLSLSIGKKLPGTERNLYLGEGGMESDGPIFDKNGNEVLGASDYVIEQGANYTKWNSGKLEQWGRIDTNMAITTALGSAFRATVPAVTFSPAFISEPILTATAFNHAGTSIDSLTAYAFSLNLSSPDSGRIASKINWYAQGRWK